MNLRPSVSGVLLLLSGLTFPVQAQPASEPSEQVTVFAPYAVQKYAIGTVRSPVLMVTMSRNVSYHDLDLKSEVDVATLKGRVRQAALDLCHELDRRYPQTIYVPIFNAKHCQANATSDGLWQVEALIALARN